ncbi:MAG: hypothetical protein K6D96_05890 [Acetatifactor sp.]|nr:hypothetical protein [Acetatifactor sp.]
MKKIKIMAIMQVLTACFFLISCGKSAAGVENDQTSVIMSVAEEKKDTDLHLNPALNNEENTENTENAESVEKDSTSAKKRADSGSSDSYSGETLDNKKDEEKSQTIKTKEKSSDEKNGRDQKEDSKEQPLQKDSSPIKTSPAQSAPASEKGALSEKKPLSDIDSQSKKDSISEKASAPQNTSSSHTENAQAEQSPAPTPQTENPGSGNAGVTDTQKECDHDYSIFSGWLQEPTCYCEGVANLKCSKCGSLGAFSGYAGSGKINHVFLKTGVIIQNATCISPAAYETACSMCGLKSVEYSGEKGEHIWRTETGVDLFGDSYEIRICEVCGLETE